jgi:hypothetical protein
MSTPFSDPITGGNILVQPAIQSPNFVPGVSGWQINANGSAFFNSITVPPGGVGIKITVAATAPGSPNTGDLWYNSSAGYVLDQWSGSAWVAYQFGTGAISNGSITAALISANTITATQLAAGIIYAGIVNGTTITGASIVADGSSGQVLIYSGTPAHGNLIGSWSGAAGTDGFTNSYPQGLSVTVGTIAGSAITGSTFTGTDFVISSTGELFYSAAPAAGNLVLSVAQASGTDSHTNTYLPGFSTYNKSTGQYTQLAESAQLSGGPGLVFGSGNANESYDIAFSMLANTQGSGGTLQGAMAMTGAADNTHGDFVALAMTSATHNGTVGPQGVLGYINNSLVETPMLTWGPVASGGTPLLTALVPMNVPSLVSTGNISGVMNPTSLAPMVGATCSTGASALPVGVFSSIPANEPVIGAGYRFRAYLSATLVSTAVTLILVVHLGPTGTNTDLPILTFPTITTQASTGTARWVYLDGWFYFTAVGASAAVVMEAKLNSDLASTTDTVSDVFSPGPLSGGTFNTATGVTKLSLIATMGATPFTLTGVVGSMERICS